MYKNFFSLLLLGVVLAFSACNKDDDDDHAHDEDSYDVTINIISPADGDMATVDANMTIDVEFTRPDNKIIHNIKVWIEDADGNEVEVIEDDHVHTESKHTVSGEFKPTEHGEYTLKVESSTDDGEKVVNAERGFMAMHATYPVTIDIQSPTPDMVATINQPMDVKVVFTHDDGDVIHHVTIVVLDENDNEVATLDSGHKHVEGSYTFDEQGAFTPDTAGNYRVQARTMNHNMSIMESAMQSFSVQ